MARGAEAHYPAAFTTTVEPMTTTRTAVRYEDDFYTWSQEQATALRRAAKSRANLSDPLDFENLAEEIESLGISQQRELYSRYAVILLHLLKWQYQPGRRSRSWRASIRTQRREIAELLLISPGLKPKRRAQLARAYIGAREDAAEQTGLPIERFPELCPYTLEQVESGDWWPEGEPG
ncbi:MAG TPA: DUF29 domain-containing protein [Geminicoccaceae bacterium]|nr:DUF29 domain-containing protein [Geminicoccaceae bacterium]